MNNKRLTAFKLVAAFLLATAPVFAHHGRSNYDTTHTTTVKGTVTEFQWINPHMLIHFDVTNENGKVENWVAEANSPNTLSRQGWNRNTLKPGDQITVSGHRLKNGATYMFANEIVFADGRELKLGIAK